MSRNVWKHFQFLKHYYGEFRNFDKKDILTTFVVNWSQKWFCDLYMTFFIRTSPDNFGLGIECQNFDSYG